MYHRTLARHLKTRRSNVCVAVRPSARSVSKRATKAGANTPRRNTAPASAVSAGEVRELKREIAKDAVQHRLATLSRCSNWRIGELLRQLKRDLSLGPSGIALRAIPDTPWL